MSAAQRIARNALLNTSSRACSLLVTILLTPFILFKLGTEGFAIWSLTYLPVMALASLDLGLNVTVTRFVAASWAKDDLEGGPEFGRFLGTGLWLLFGLDAPIAAILVLFSPQYLSFLNVPPTRLLEAQFVLLVTLVVFAVTNPFGLYQAGLYGLQRLDWVAALNILTNMLLAAIAFITLQLGLGLYGLCIGAAAVEIGNAALLAFAFRRSLRGRFGNCLDWRKFDTRTVRQMLSYGARIQVSNLGSLATTQFTKILAGHFLSLSTVAAYELGLRLAFSITYLPVWSMAAVLPAASAMAGLPNRAQLVELYQRGTKYVWICAMLLAGMVWLTAPQILVIWTGTPQPEATLVARWLAVAFAINLVTAVGTTIARGIGRAGLETRYSLLVLGALLTGTVIFAQGFGLNGLVFANTFALALGSAYFVLLFQRELEQSLLGFIRQILARPILVSLPLLMLGVFLMGQMPLSPSSSRPVALLVLAAAMGIYAAFYLAGLGAVGYFQSGDFVIFKGTVKSLNAARGSTCE